MRRTRKPPEDVHLEAPVDPAHAPGKRRLGRPAQPPHHEARETPPARIKDQPWVPTSGLVGRHRRSARRG